MINIAVMETGPLNVNTYIISEIDSQKCIIIDPADGGRVKKYIDEHRLTCTHILLTHGHFDHLLGVAALKRETHASVLIHEYDAPALSSDKENLAVYIHTSTEKCTADQTLRDGDCLDLNGIKINVMHTPGHSRGSVCYILEEEGVIFSGDTLFRLSVGRCDLYHSNKSDLIYSILYKLYALHGDYKVLPGHGEPTELDFERLNNPFTNSMDYE